MFRTDPSAPRTFRRRLLPACCLVAAMFLPAGCGLKEPKPRPGEVERLPRLEVITPVQTDLARRIELTAMVEPMEKADLCARVPGVVEYLAADIDIGRPVRGPRDGKAGEVLVKLAVPDLEAQKKHKEALLEQARKQRVQADEARNVGAKEVAEAEKLEKRYAAEATLARLTYDRTAELARRQAVQPELVQEKQRGLEAAEAALDAARAAIETKKAKLRSLEAEVETAQAKIAVAEAEVQSLTVQIAYATITAPFDGVVTKRWVDRGATVKDAGAPLLTVMRTDMVRVLLDIPERDVPLVNATRQRANGNNRGDTVTLRVPALVDVVPDGEFKAPIEIMNDALDPNTHTLRAEVHLDNKTGHLKPGMYGQASILLEERYGVHTLPATALLRRGGKAEVYYVADVQGDPPRGVVRRVEVELGLDDGKLVEIKLQPSGGLKGDELIIAKGNGVVRAGDTVVPVRVKE